MMSFLKQLREKSKTQISQESLNNNTVKELVLKLSGLDLVPNDLYPKIDKLLKTVYSFGSVSGGYNTSVRLLSSKEVIDTYNRLQGSGEFPKGSLQKNRQTSDGRAKYYPNFNKLIPIISILDWDKLSDDVKKSKKYPYYCYIYIDLDPGDKGVAGQTVIYKPQSFLNNDGTFTAHSIHVGGNFVNEILKRFNEKNRIKLNKNNISHENINEYYTSSKPYTRKDWVTYFELVENQSGVKLPKDVIDFFTKTNKPELPLSAGPDLVPPFFKDKDNQFKLNKIDIAEIARLEGYPDNWISTIGSSKYRTNYNPKQIKPLPTTNTSWVPLVCFSELGTYPVVVDMDPASGGKVGQVIKVQIADGYFDTELLANSFTEYLKNPKTNTQISQESIQDVKTLEDVFKLAKVPYDKAFDVLKKGKYEGKYGTYLSEKEIVKYYTDISLNYETPKGVGQRFKSRWNAGVDKDSKDAVNGHSYKLYGNWARRIPIMGRSSGGDHPIVGLTFLDFDPTYPKFKGQLIKVDTPTKVITRFDRTVNAKEEMSNQHGIIVLNEVIKDLKGELKVSNEGILDTIKGVLGLGTTDNTYWGVKVDAPKEFIDNGEIKYTLKRTVYPFYNLDKGEDPLEAFTKLIPKVLQLVDLSKDIDKVLKSEKKWLEATGEYFQALYDGTDGDTDIREGALVHLSAEMKRFNERNKSVTKKIESIDIWDSFYKTVKPSKDLTAKLKIKEEYIELYSEIMKFKSKHYKEVKDWMDKYHRTGIDELQTLLNAGDYFEHDAAWEEEIIGEGFFHTVEQYFYASKQIVEALDKYIPFFMKATHIDTAINVKVSVESRSINPKTIVALILKILAKKVYKKYLQNPVREKYYSLMKYQNCNEKSLDNTMSKLKGINDTAIVDGFEVKEVPGKTFTNSFIVNDKQLKTEEDIYKAVDLVVKEVGTLSDIITVIHKNAKSIKLSKDIDEEQAVNEVFGLIEKHIPKNIFQQFLPTTQPEDLVKVGGCNSHGRIKSKLINAIRPELLGAYKDLKDLLDDSEVDKNIRDGVGKELSKILDRYFTFIADVVEWMYRSMRRQTKKSGIATESYIYYYSLEDAEKEEAEYDAENAVAEDPEADTSEDVEEDVSEEDTETESETTESDDEETEGTSDEGSEDAAEETKERREETRVELDNPDEEKQTIKNYLVPLAGDTVEELTLYTAKEVNRPLYHVSMNPSIKAFYPKVSKRTLSKEDRSIPRISTSTSLIGCLNGYQSMVSDMEGRETKNFSGLFKVYDLPYQYAVKPSTKVVADVGNSDEYWLVSWKKETYATVPTVAADFTIPKIETVYGKDGKDQTYHCYIRVYTNLYLDHEKQLNQGYYHVVLNGYNFKYPLSNNKLISIHEISETEYNKVVALSMMVKHR